MGNNFQSKKYKTEFPCYYQVMETRVGSLVERQMLWEHKPTELEIQFHECFRELDRSRK